jgi:carboxymethylenebutenolidase
MAKGESMQISQPDGYMAIPPDGKGEPVLVLHAWWGLNETIKLICNRLAQNGFMVFAPDLYHGKIAKTIPEAEILGRAIDSNQFQAKAEIAEAARFLLQRAGLRDRGLAAIGFSLGAYYAADLAINDPDNIRSVVLFYGTGPGDFSKSKAAFLGHFAENDEYEPQEYADALEKGLKQDGCPVNFHRYPGTKHWFFEPDRPDEYNREAAELAWERTLAFLKRLS